MRETRKLKHKTHRRARVGVPALTWLAATNSVQHRLLRSEAPMPTAPKRPAVFLSGALRRLKVACGLGLCQARPARAPGRRCADNESKPVSGGNAHAYETLQMCNFRITEQN